VSLLKQLCVRGGLELTLIHNLAGSHVGVEQFRPSLCHADAEHRTPGLAEKHDTGLMEPRPDKLGNFDAIEGHLIDGDGGGHRSGPAERSASAALIPPDDGEVASPAEKDVSRE
jgi:hypothetical protein